MNRRKRLYPTLKEEREMEELKKRFGLGNSGSAIEGGVQKRNSKQEVRTKDRERRD